MTARQGPDERREPVEPPRPPAHDGRQGARPPAPDEPQAQGALGPGESRRAAARERRAILLRLDPALHDALARWASDELRSVNAQIDLLLRDALARADRLPGGLHPPRRPGRPAGPAEAVTEGPPPPAG